MKSERQYPRDRSYDDSVVELFQKDPLVAVELLNSILVDEEPGELTIAKYPPC